KLNRILTLVLCFICIFVSVSCNKPLNQTQTAAEIRASQNTLNDWRKLNKNTFRIEKLEEVANEKDIKNENTTNKSNTYIIKDFCTGNIAEYDENDILISYTDVFHDYKYYYEYDNNNNLIHEYILDKYERWYEYDENNNLIYIYTADQGEIFEVWYEYDNNGNRIHTKFSPTVYEDWYEYDENGKLIHYKNTNGFEVWQIYDNNTVYYKNSNGEEFQYEYTGTNISMPKPF
ncbi:MAG: hypothetical protein ACI4RV_07590, partial [Eubacteriales bacterium]